MRMIILLALMATAGCASEQAQLVAGRTMSISQSLASQLETFANAKNAELRNRHEHVTALERAAAIDATEAKKVASDWKTRGEDRAALLFEETTRSDGGRLAVIHSPLDVSEPSAAPSNVTFDATQHKALVKALDKIAQPASARDQAEFLLSYAGAVGAKMAADIEAAAKGNGGVTPATAAPKTTDPE